jgi:hypothetical protein
MVLPSELYMYPCTDAEKAANCSKDRRVTGEKVSQKNRSEGTAQKHQKTVLKGNIDARHSGRGHGRGGVKSGMGRRASGGV